MWLDEHTVKRLTVRISTHTSRVGCDTAVDGITLALKDFYSHIPCGMWQLEKRLADVYKHFYSHIPCGMWRFDIEDKVQARLFLLTHPVWDVTQKGLCTICFLRNFYSHIPCGMWRLLQRALGYSYEISTHTSRVGCDCWNCCIICIGLFLLTHPVWDVTCMVMQNSTELQFLLTHPVWDVTHTSHWTIMQMILFLLTHPVWDVTVHHIMQ